MRAEGKQDLDDYLMVLTCVVIVLLKTNMFAFRVSVCAVEWFSLSVTSSIERSWHDRPTIVIQLLETTKGWSIPCLDRCRLVDVLLLELISLGKERKSHLPSDIPICATARPRSLFPHVLAGECSKKLAKPMGSLCFQIHQITRFSSSSLPTSQGYRVDVSF